MEALPAAIGAGGSLISGLIGADAASSASKAQQAGIRRGQDIQAQLALLARQDLAPTRDFNTSMLNYLADVMGLHTGADLGNKPGAQGRDPYNDPNMQSYLNMAKPYIEGLQPVTNDVAGIANMFGAAPGASGQPAWYQNALAGFKGTPDYQFTRDEALRTGLQAAGTGGNIAGGGREMAMENRAAGLASQNFGGFRDSIINSILAGGKMGLAGYDELANMLGKGLSWGTSAAQADDTRYSNFFNRLLQASGLGSAGVQTSAKLASDTGTNLAQLDVLGGAAASKGITGSASQLGTGITGATAALTGINSPLNPMSLNSWLSSSGGGSSTGENVPAFNYYQPQATAGDPTGGGCFYHAYLDRIKNMPEIMSQLPDGGEVKIPNMLDVMSKQAQTDKYNLDVAKNAREFYGLKQWGQGAAAGDPEAQRNLLANAPEAAQTVASTLNTYVTTQQGKENLVKGIMARGAQMGSQISDPEQQKAIMNQGLDFAVQKGAVPQAEADAVRHHINTNPQQIMAGLINSNLTAAQTPLVSGQVAQAQEGAKYPYDEALQRQRLRAAAPVPYPNVPVMKDGKPVLDEFGNPTFTTRHVAPMDQPGTNVTPNVLQNPNPFGTIGEPTGATPARPGSGSSTYDYESSTGPGSIRRSSALTPAPSTYIPGSGSSSASAIPAPNDEIKGLISAASAKHGVPEELLTRVLHGESGYDPTLEGQVITHGPAKGTTAKGIGQFIDSTAASRGVKQWDTASSVDGAAAYLAELKQQRGSWYGAISGYLGGPPNPRNNRSYFTSGVVQTARSLDARGAAPPAPGSTAPSGTTAVPGAPTATTTAPAPVPPPAAPGGAPSSATGGIVPRGASAAPEIPPLSSTTARTAPRAAGAGFDLAAGDSIAYGAVRHAKLPGKEIGTVPRDSSQVQYDAAGSRDPTQALEYIEANADKLKDKKIFWSSGLMNAGRTAEIAERSLPQVEEQLSQLVHNGNSVVLAGVDQGKYASLNPRLQELVDKVEAEKGDATGSVKFGGPLPTNNVHPGPPGYRDYVNNAAKLLEEKRSDAEPEATYGSSLPPGSTDTSAGADKYNTGGAQPANTVPPADRSPLGTPIPPAESTGPSTNSIIPVSPGGRGVPPGVDEVPYNVKEKAKSDQAVEQARRDAENAADIASQDKFFNNSVTENKEAINGQMQLHIVENALSKVTTGLTGSARQTLYRGISEIGHMLNLDTSDTRENTARDRLVALFNKAGAEAGSQSAYMALINTSGSQLAFSMVKALGSREAVQVVDQVMRIKPNLGLDNEENQAIVNALRQGFQRTIDKHEYLLEHRKDKGGLFKAEAQFEKEKPAAMYASRVIPFPISSPDNMINNVRYDLSTIPGKKEEYKGKIGVWDSDKKAFAEE